MEGGETKMRILCLHGFRTSGSFLKKQISRWDPSIFAHFDMDFPDGLFPAGGKSDIEHIFPGPYFEWFQFDKEFKEYTGLEECMTYLCEYITSKGPFDGLLGFSQGAALAGLLLGYKTQDKVLQNHPPIKLFVSISGAKFRKQTISEVAYKNPIAVKSVHFIGAKDYLRLPSEDFAATFVDPLIIRHDKGHTVPRLDEGVTEQLHNWTKAFQLQTSNKEANKEEAAEKEDVESREMKTPQEAGETVGPEEDKREMKMKHTEEDNRTEAILVQASNKEVNNEKAAEGEDVEAGEMKTQQEDEETNSKARGI